MDVREEGKKLFKKEIKIREHKENIENMVEEKFPNMIKKASTELVEILLEHRLSSLSTPKIFIFNVLISTIIPALLIYLCSLFSFSSKLFIGASLVICTGFIVGTILTIGEKIFVRVGNTEIYLNTIHDDLLKKNCNQKQREETSEIDY
jgi:hypothetical protein